MQLASLGQTGLPFREQLVGVRNMKEAPASTAAWQIFWAIMVLPKPLAPTRTRCVLRRAVQHERPLDDITFL